MNSNDLYQPGGHFYSDAWWFSGEGNGNPLQCSCLENPKDRGAWWAAVHGVAQSQTRQKRLSMHACIGDGKGNPLQCSCLENPRDRGAWWAAIYGVTQSWTQLMQLSSSNMVIHASLLFLSLLENSLKLKLERLFITNKIYAIICNIYLLWKRGSIVTYLEFYS